MTYNHLRIRHRDKHDGRPFAVYQTLSGPRRFAATWEGDPTPSDADCTSPTFCQAIDALLLSVQPVNAAAQNVFVQPQPDLSRDLQPELF